MMNSPAARHISLILALVLSALLFIFPQVVTENGKAQHSLLMLLLIGNIIGYIHGVGFKAYSKLYQLILSPLVGWPMMITGIVYSLFKSELL
jgi:predicted membrane protein